MSKRRGNSLRILIYRSEARKIAQEQVLTHSELNVTEINPTQIRFAPIDKAALDACLDWKVSTQNYPWQKVPEWAEKDPKAFDLAIWYGYTLCGLCYATPRRSTIRIKIVLLEGNPEKHHPLRGFVMGLALVPIEAYARMLGLSVIEVQDPAKDALSKYQQLGFKLNADGCLAIDIARQYHRPIHQGARGAYEKDQA